MKRTKVFTKTTTKSDISYTIYKETYPSLRDMYYVEDSKGNVICSDDPHNLKITVEEIARLDETGKLIFD